MSDAETLNLADDAPDPFREVAGRREMKRLMDAVQSLPERCRTVVLRRRLGEETPREIAESTGQSLSTLEKRLARGMQLLAAALSFDAEPAARREPAEEPRSKTDDAANG